MRKVLNERQMQSYIKRLVMEEMCELDNELNPGEEEEFDSEEEPGGEVYGENDIEMVKALDSCRRLGLLSRNELINKVQKYYDLDSLESLVSAARHYASPQLYGEICELRKYYN